MKHKNPLGIAAMGLSLLLGSAHGSDLSYFLTRTNTDYTSFGFGSLRDNGAGTLAVSGLSGDVTGAYLFWAGPADDRSATANASFTFNGSTVHGSSLGLTADNNWGFNNSQAYQANITSLITGNGNYDFSGLVKDSGRTNINGLSLLVFYDDHNAANNRDIVLFAGNDSNQPNTYDAYGWNVSLPGIDYTSGTAGLEFHVSDGQSYYDDGVTVNGNLLLPVGSNFDGTVPQHNGSNPTDNLWDVRQLDVTSLLSPGLNTLTVGTHVYSDYLSAIVMAIDLPAGSAPPPPRPPTGMSPVPEPSTYGLLAAAGLIAVVAYRRRLASRQSACA